MSRPPQVRLIGADADLEAELDLARRAFGPFGDAGRELRLAVVQAAAASGRYIGAFDGPSLIGSALYYDLRQWWHGRAVPMAGIGWVKVAPEHRGRGVGGALMTELLTEIAARGYPLSVLYPATAQLYRSAGWELAGGQYKICLPARSLRSLQPPEFGADEPVPAVVRAGPDDAVRVLEVLGLAHGSALDCGPATFDVQAVRHWLGQPDVFGYLADDGFAAYRWQDGNSEIAVDRVVAATGPATRALWSVIGSHGSVADRVRACVGPADPVGWLTREPDVRPLLAQAWMLRVAGAPAAIAGRGFPAAAKLSVRLALHDPQLPANSGAWNLEIGGGRGALCQEAQQPPGPSPAPRRPGAGDPLTLGPRGFAALYAGVPLATLRRSGLAAGDAAADSALDTAFSARPYLLDFF